MNRARQPGPQGAGHPGGGAHGPVVHHAETPALIFAAMAATIEDRLMPQLTDASARAAAASMLQVLAQLTTTVAWDPVPLAARLQARSAQLEALGAFGDADLPQPPPTAGTGASAAELESQIRACDAYASSLVPLAARATATGAPALERWLLAYGRQAADIDLRFAAPSHLGKLTRKGGPKAPHKDAA